MNKQNITKYLLANDINLEKQEEIKVKIPLWIEQDKEYLNIKETNIIIELDWVDPLNTKLQGFIRNQNNEIIKEFKCDEFFQRFEYNLK